jgi:hypothetical protein
MSIRMLENTLEDCRWHRKELNLNDAILCWGGPGGAHTIYRILPGAQGISWQAGMSIRMLENTLEDCRWLCKELNLNDAILCWGGPGGAHTIYRILPAAQDLSGMAEVSIRILVNTLEDCRWHRKKLNSYDVTLSWGEQEEHIQYTG